MALSKLAKRRLETLIKFMASMPASANKHFDMSGWFSHDADDHDHKIRAGAEINKGHLHKCGTSACALGWGCMIPSFRKAGLRLFQDNTGMGEVRFGHDLKDGDAAMRFFAIDYTQMVDLLAADNGDKTPKQWAKRVRGLVKEWSAP